MKGQISYITYIVLIVNDKIMILRPIRGKRYTSYRSLIYDK